MIPTYNFTHFKKLLQKFETELTETTICVLFVNFSQIDSSNIKALQQSIIRYNEISGTNINFYIPGLSTDKEYPSFFEEGYIDFLIKFEKEFGITKIPATPTMLLMEYSDKMAHPKHILINLLNEDHTMVDTDKLFRLIVENAKERVNIGSFGHQLATNYLLTNAPEIINNFMKKQWGTLICKNLIGALKFRVRG
ncbi:MAG: hypothetical protein MJY93_01530 [Fibrobacter sp.]|nr:hypothetical protein [Fibrobacter sp.]